MKKILLMSIFLTILFLSIDGMNDYYYSNWDCFFYKKNIIKSQYYLIEKASQDIIEVSVYQWLFSNNLFLASFILLNIDGLLFFYFMIKYGIPYFYYKKYKNIYD